MALLIKQNQRNGILKNTIYLYQPNYIVQMPWNCFQCFYILEGRKKWPLYEPKNVNMFLIIVHIYKQGHKFLSMAHDGKYLDIIPFRVVQSNNLRILISLV